MCKCCYWKCEVLYAFDGAQLSLFVRYLTLTGDKALIEHSSHMRALAWGLARRLPRKQRGFHIAMDVFF